MPTWTRFLRMFALALALFLCPAAPSAPQIPSIEGHVTDAGKLLSKEDREQIDQALGGLQGDNKLDFAMLILNQPEESLEEFGQAVFTTWSIGKEWQGGILLLISKDLKECRLIMDKQHPVFKEDVAQQIESQLRSDLSAGNLAKGLRRAISKARRVSGAQRPHAEIPPPFEPNREGGRRYAMATLAVLILAVVSSRLRK